MDSQRIGFWASCAGVDWTPDGDPAAARALRSKACQLAPPDPKRAVVVKRSRSSHHAIQPRDWRGLRDIRFSSIPCALWPDRST